MNKILKYIPVLGVALAFGACESDIEETIYNSGAGKPAVLSSLNPAYVLDAQQSDQTAFTLQWTEPDMGYSAVVTNYVQIDTKDGNFNHYVVAASMGKGGQYSFNHYDLNNVLLGILEDQGKEIAATDFVIRIASSISAAADTLYSNVIETNITPFVGERQYPSISVRGDYNGWDWASCQKVYSVNEDNNYAGMIYFDGKAQNGWKFCGDEGWSVDNWGVGESAVTEGNNTLVQGGGDIKVYSRTSYYLEFNNSTGELKVSQAYDSWGIVGAHNGWGSGDTPMTLGTETDATGTVQHYLTATMDMEGGNTWKIRPDEKWENDKGPGQLAFEGDVADNGDGNFRVDDTGNYTIKWYFNKVEQKLVVTKN